MNKEMLDFYLKTSMYTNYEPYKEYYKSLPNDMEELTDLILSQTIHRKPHSFLYVQGTHRN